ncbi:hypothetical protein Tco_0872265, partial [Tanacetum coccineum]
MPTEMELTLEQTQQGVSYEVLRLHSFLPTFHSELVELKSYLSAEEHPSDFIHNEDENPALVNIKQAHGRKLKDGGEDKEFQISFCHSDTERVSRSDKVLKLKNFKKDATLKLFKSTNQEREIEKMDIACSCSTISKIRDKCLLHGWDLHVNVEVHGKVELVYDQLLYKVALMTSWHNDGGDNSCVSLGNNLQLVLVVMILQFGEVDDQLCESSYEFWIRIF